MLALPREIEVDRVVNLVQGFGWVKVKEEMIGTELYLTFKKTLLTPDQAEETGVPA